MNAFDWKICIKLNLLLLKVGGLWPKINYLPDSYSFYTVICFAVFIVGDTFFQTVNIFVVSNDLEAMTNVIYIFFTKAVAIYKISCFVKNMKIVKEFMIVANSNIFQPKNEHQKTLILPLLSAWKKLFATFFAMSWSTILLWSLFPILDRSQGKRLPFLAWYPYDIQKSPLYEITYVYQVLSVSYCTIATIGVDVYIASLNMFVAIQFDLLCDNLKNVKFSTRRKAFEALRFCITHHQTILRYV